VVVSERVPLRTFLSHMAASLWPVVLASILVTFGTQGLGYHWITVPGPAITVVGLVLGIFLGFRTNRAYERWWEGRKLWGSMVNVSRHWTHQTISYAKVPFEERAEVVRTHAMYVHALRAFLRHQAVCADPDVKRLATDEEIKAMRAAANPPAALLSRQTAKIAEWADEGALTEDRLRVMDQSLRVILDVQGGCERIRNTPIPVTYTYFTRLAVIMFTALLPMEFVEFTGWWTLLAAPLVGLAFFVLDEAGILIQAPFATNPFGLPLSALSRSIEIDARQRIGDHDIPPALQPHKGVLM